MPKTISSPKSYVSAGYDESEFISKVADELGFPLIVKENFGSFGQQVYKAENEQALLKIVKSLAGKPFLFQEFIKTSEGRDIRLHVVGGEAVACMYRYNDDDFRANVTNGGKMKPYKPTKEQIEMALSSCRILGLDFASVDILFGKDDIPMLCEVNSNAHMKNILDCTGVNVADFIMQHVKECIR